MEQKPPAGHWIVDSEEALLESRVMTLMREDCHASIDPSKTHRFYTLRTRDWCNVIPVTEDGKVVLVRQYRVGTRLHTLEFPGGVVDHDGEGLAETALRELAEETGYAPLPGARCIPLGQSQSNPAIFNNRVHSFIVGPVRRVSEQKLDPGEMIEVIEVPISDVPRLAESGEISHALMLVTFLHLVMRAPESKELLARSLGEFSR